MKFERRLKTQTRVDLTPLIDVVFQLVIFFMVSSVFRTAPGIPMDLPVSATPEPIPVSQIHIKVLSNDQIYVNQTLTSIEGLGNLISASMEELENPDVIVEGDKELPYQTLVGVLDSLRSLGITDVGLVMAPGEAVGDSP